MTEKQIKTLVKVYDELSKSFAHLVIIVSEKETLASDILPDPNLFWSGGYVGARYIIHDAVDKIARRKFNSVSPNQLLRKKNEK